MITLFFVSVLAAIAILCLGKRLAVKPRLALSLVAFLLINLPTILFLVLGDKPLPGARTVTPEEVLGTTKNTR
jgi:hypothetical protein